MIFLVGSLVRKFKIWVQRTYIVSDIYIAQIKSVQSINLEKEKEVKNYFEYTVKHQEFGPHQYLITMRFPKSMEKEVRDFYQDNRCYFNDDDSDWEI